MKEIEKGVPIPIDAGRGRGARKYPFRSMEVGDSFLIAFKDQKAIYASAMNQGAKITCQKQDDGSVRVWRIA